MTAEQSKLTDARNLFAKFEAEMDQPDGIAHLEGALSILVDILEDSESENIIQVASNIALSYAKKIQDRVELLISREKLIHWETVDHWQKVFDVYKDSEFTLPQDITETFSKLLWNKVKIDVNQMSPGEKKRFVDYLLKE